MMGDGREIYLGTVKLDGNAVRNNAVFPHTQQAEHGSQTTAGLAMMEPRQLGRRAAWRRHK